MPALRVGRADARIRIRGAQLAPQITVKWETNQKEGPLAGKFSYTFF